MLLFNFVFLFLFLSFSFSFSKDIWVKTKPKRDKKKNEDEKKDEKEEGGWTALHFASYYFGRFSSGDEDAMVDVVDAILCRCSGSHGIPWALSLKTPEGLIFFVTGF